MDCRCRGPVRLGHDKQCERYNSIMRENGGSTVSNSYTLNKRVDVDMKFPKKRLMEILASDECWSANGEFNKFVAIKVVRIEWTLGLKSAKELVEDFMNPILRA